MDHLFGVAELTDAEKAVVGYGDERPKVMAHHIWKCGPSQESDGKDGTW
jgi:hypothetical protein